MAFLVTVVLGCGVLLLAVRYAFTSDAYRRAKVAKGAQDYQRQLRTTPWRMDIAAKGVRKDLPSLFSRQDDKHLEALRQKVLRDLAFTMAGAMLFMVVQVALELA